MAILIPLMRPICEKFDKRKSLLLFVLLCVAIEIVCSVINLPNAIYRLLCLRYVMLVWFGWIWAKEGIKLNMMTIIISLLSVGCIIYLEYYTTDLEPLFYNTDWVTHRWVSYFWVSWLFVGILFGLYKIIMKSEAIKRIVKILASASYEIFLVQMAYYAIVKSSDFSFAGNNYVQFVLWFVFAFIVSIMGGIVLNKIEKYLTINLL